MNSLFFSLLPFVRNRAFPCAALVLISSLHCSANLEDDVAACEAQYGAPVSKICHAPFVDESFSKDGVSIRIQFLDGKACSIDYNKFPGGFSAREVDDLLRKNSGGEPWLPSYGGWQAGNTVSTQRNAYWDSVHPQLVVFSDSRFTTALIARKKADANKLATSR
jgi:hypothetical protein